MTPSNPFLELGDRPWVEVVTPADLGFPEKFTSFRPIQREIAKFSTAQRDEHVVAIGAPTGSGKTLAIQLAGMLAGVKFGVLTGTKALQDQVEGDHFDYLADVRGRINYDCAHPEWSGANCEKGDDTGCPYSDKVACPYKLAYALAAEARAFVTNYAYWTAVRRLSNDAFASEDYGPVELLVMDEAHLAPDELARHLAFWISRSELVRFAGEELTRTLNETAGQPYGPITDPWRVLLTIVRREIGTRLSEILDRYSGVVQRALRHDRQYKYLSKLYDGANRVLSHSEDGNWLWREAGNGYRFECIWPARYAQQYLFSGVSRILLVSATLRPKCLQLLGLMMSSVAYKEFPRQFPAQNGPVWWVPTGRMRYDQKDDILASVARTDEMAELWRNYKGIIHTSSYAYAKRVMELSRYSGRMILNEPGEAMMAADKYRRAGAGAMLVSPSYGTGWDFPDEECVWQHVNKLPFADRSDPVVEARMRVDPGWYNYDCAQKLVQRCGRGTRHHDDKCCTVITDDAVKNFRFYAKDFMPQWFSVREWKDSKDPLPGPRSLGLQ